MRIHGNIKTGAKKGAKTRRQGNKIEAAGDYYRERISEFMVAHNTGLSTAQIAARAGLTVASLRASYLPHMSLEEQTALFGTGFVDEPEPEPPVVGTADEPTTLGDYMPEPETPEPPVAVADSPQEDEPEPEPEPEIEAEAEPEAIEDEAEEDDELSIPDEPKEWGVSVYGADLNNEAPQDKDAA
jgi:outer membrane biosynthesis protein TonB